MSFRSITRPITFLCALFALQGRAQTTIQLQDSADGSAVSFARVAVLALDSAVLGGFETDDRGQVTVPAQVAEHATGGWLRVVALGYRPSLIRFPSGEVRLRLVRERHELEEVVVTGQYGPLRADQAVHKVRVIDAERLQRLAATDLSDALRNELNIRLSQDNILGTSMSMQGLSGENVKILVDGVPVIGRQDGNIDLAQIDLNGVDRIEVVEGPLSVSYGTNALAGTINIITKKAAGTAPSVKLSAYAEQVGRLNLWGTYAQRWGRHNLNVNAGRDIFLGWHPGQEGIVDLGATPADTSRFLQWKPREQYTARVNYRWNGARWQFGYKGEFSDDVIINRGRPDAPYFETAFDERYRTDRIDNAVFADRQWAHGRKLSVLAAHDRYVRTRNTWRRDLTTLSELLVATGGMQDTSRFTLSNVRAVYASAGDSAKLRYEFGTDLNYETGTGQRIGDGEQVIGDYAVYTSVEYRPVQRLVLRPAVRYAHNTVYGAPLVPSFNLRWQLHPAVVARASYARGFRAPSLKELYFFFVDVNHNIQGNLDLKAEHSNNYSASLTWSRTASGRTWRAELGGFFNDIEDLITLAQVDGSLYSYVNIGDYRTAGGTAGVSWENARWSLTVGGNLTGRRDGLMAEQQQGFLWSHEGRTNVAYIWPKCGLQAQVFVKYQGELQNYTYGSDGSVGRGRMEAFVVGDASVTKTAWAKRLGITFGCKNLFDVQNVNTSFGSGGVHDAASASVPMMMGRIWFVRLELGLTGKQ
jgi:outer membrane receptor for ferrienterochelin and colicins